MKGEHFCLVVSPRSFNERFRLAVVCPISGGEASVARNSGFLISLMGTGLRTGGNVHVHQMKALDWANRQSKLIEKVPDYIMEQVLDCLTAVFDPGEE